MVHNGRNTPLCLQQSLLVVDARGALSKDTIPEDRHQLELSRFLQQDLKKPEMYNLNNMGALSQSGKMSLRFTFKG